MRKIKIIDLLCLISNDEETPEKIKYNDNVFRKCDIGDDYFDDAYYDLFFKDIFDTSIINDEVEILDDEAVKPITKKDLETLGYACGEIKKCIEKGFNKSLNNEPLEDDDKDIPLIPDDELIILKQSKTVDMQYAIDFNFKVLKEKINQVVEEFNEYRKGNE